MIKGKLVVVSNLTTFKTIQQSSDPIPDSAIVFIKNEGQIWTKGSYFGVQKTYDVVSKTDAGLAPKGGDSASSLIANVDDEWVLTVTNGANPSWRKLPDNAFKNQTYTFYNLAFKNSSGTTVDTYKPSTSPSKSVKAGTNVEISASSNTITISATDTTYNAFTGASDSTDGSLGLVPKPTKGNQSKFLKADGTWVKPSLSEFTDDVVSGNYLPLSGGTISNTDTGLTINRDTGSSKNPHITFQSNGVAVGDIGINHDGAKPMWYNYSTNTWNDIITSDNAANYNVGSATKLQTARTIWGQSFDGTTDITAPPKVYKDASSYISFYSANGSTYYGDIGFNYGSPAICTNTLKWKTLLHEGNYSSYALPLSGGTMNDGAHITMKSNVTSGNWIGSSKWEFFAYSTTFQFRKSDYDSDIYTNILTISTDGFAFKDQTVYHSGNITTALSNYVDLSSDQIITGKKTFSHPIFSKNNVGIWIQKSQANTNDANYVPYIRFGKYTANNVCDNTTVNGELGVNDSKELVFYKGTTGDKWNTVWHSGNLDLSNYLSAINLTGSDDGRYTTLNNSGFSLHAANGGWAMGIETYKYDGTHVGGVCGAFGTLGGFSYWYYGGYYNAATMYIKDSKLGIGTNSPEAKLHIKQGNIFLYSSSVPYIAFKNDDGSSYYCDIGAYNGVASVWHNGRGWETILTSGNWSSYISVSGGNFLPLSGGTMNAGARIGHAGTGIYLGNSANDGWVYTQDICSHSGHTYWNIYTSGNALFLTLDCKTLQINGSTLTFVT